MSYNKYINVRNIIDVVNVEKDTRLPGKPREYTSKLVFDFIQLYNDEAFYLCLYKEMSHYYNGYSKIIEVLKKKLARVQKAWAIVLSNLPLRCVHLSRI